MTTVDKIKAKFEALRVSLHERARREWVGAEARALGHGGVKLVHEATGIAALVKHLPGRNRGRPGGQERCEV